MIIISLVKLRLGYSGRSLRSQSDVKQKIPKKEFRCKGKALKGKVIFWEGESVNLQC